MQQRRNSIANALELSLSCTNPSVCGNHVDGSMHERLNSIANALELHLSCTNPWMCDFDCLFPSAGRHGINQESLLAVLEVLGVGMLSNHVSVEEITESYQPCPPLQHYARFALPAIQRLLCSDHEELYSKLMDKYKMDTRVPAMQFGQVRRLESFCECAQPMKDVTM